MAQTDPLASGINTSEGKMTAALCIVGLALESFGAVLSERLQEHPSAGLGVAFAVIGAVTQILAVLGYGKNRSALKSNTLMQGLAAGVPLVVTAVSQAVLKSLPTPMREVATSGMAEQAQKATMATVSSTMRTPIETPKVNP